MTKAESAYNLLLMLSVIDGEIDDIEREVIKSWIDSKYDSSVDFEKQDQALAKLSSDELLEQFHTSAQKYYEESDSNERRQLMQTALHVVQSDGVISKEEVQIFKGLADVWGVDMQQFM